MSKKETAKRKRADTEGFTTPAKKAKLPSIESLRILLSVAGPLSLDVNIARIAVESDGDESVECVELLSRDHRVDWNRRNDSGDTPLMYCIKNNKTEMVEIIGGISGIRNTVTESEISFMRDLIRKKRVEIKKQQEKLIKLECEFEVNKVRNSQEYMEDTDIKQEKESSREKYLDFPDPEVKKELKKEQEKSMESRQEEYVEYPDDVIKLELKQEQEKQEEHNKGEYIEYPDPEIKLKDSEEDVEYMEKPHIKLEMKEEKKEEQVIKDKPSKEESKCEECSVDTDYDIKHEPTLKLEPSVTDTGEEDVVAKTRKKRVVEKPNNKRQPKNKISEKSTMCKECGKMFSSKGTMMVHYRSKHEGIKYPCNQCDYQATTQGSLKRHTKSIH